VFFIAGYVRWRRFPLGLTVSLAAASCAALALYLWQYGGESPAISVLRRCNITNATFAGFLPYAKNKPRAVALVGLPPHCNQYVGMNWYDPRMAGGHPCPEVFKVSRLSLLYLCWDDPTILWRLLNRALFDLETDCYGLLPIDLGNVEGVSRGRVPRPTVSDLVLRLGYYPRRIFYLLPAAIVAFYMIRAVVGLRRSWPPGPGILVIMAGLIAYSSFAITILGDGFLDYMRHNLLAINLLLVIYLTAAGHFAWWLGRRWFAVAGAMQQPAETAANVPSKSHRLAAWCAAAGATALYLGLTAGAVLIMREPYPHVAFEQSKVDASLGHCGTAENVLRGANDQLLLFGWAYDRRNQSRAARIIITCDGIPLPVHVLRGMSRRDVETGLGLPPTSRIGWETSIPARLAKRGCWLNFYAVLDDGKIVELRKAEGLGLVR